MGAEMEIMDENKFEKKLRMGKIGKTIFWIIGISIALAILIFLFILTYMNLNKDDLSEVDDLFLYPSSEIITEENNAFYDIKQASENIYWPANQYEILNAMSDGTQWDEDLASSFLEKNKANIDFFDQGIQKLAYQDPAIQGDINLYSISTILSSTAKVRILARVKVIQSWKMFKNGDEIGAFNNSLKLIDIGNKIQNTSRVNLINFLAATSIKNMGLINIQQMIPLSNLGTNELSNFQNELGSFENNEKGLQEAFRMEYVSDKHLKKQMIDNVFTTEGNESRSLAGPITMGNLMMKSRFYYKPNETQKIFIDMYAKIIDDAAKKCNEIVPSQKIIEDKSFIKILFRENAMGKNISDILAVNGDKAIGKRCEEDFFIYATKFMFAAQSYKNDNGSYPLTMDILSPKYMQVVLTEFDGKPLKYDSQLGTISLGQ